MKTNVRVFGIWTQGYRMEGGEDEATWLCAIAHLLIIARTNLFWMHFIK